jgi:hypothetical protein
MGESTMIPRDRFDRVLKGLESHFNTELEAFNRDALYSFANERFSGIAKFEKAASLVMIHEKNYGRFPAFEVFSKLFNEFLQTSAPAYQTPSSAALALPPAQERGVSPKDWTPLTAEEIANAKWGQLHPVIERLKAKITVSAFFKSQTTIAHGTKFREEAIAEAQARGIPLDLIGAAEKVAA